MKIEPIFKIFDKQEGIFVPENHGNLKNIISDLRWKQYVLSLTSNRYIYCQAIGIKDKNGTLLFSGDIVEICKTGKKYKIVLDLIYGLRFEDEHGHHVLPIRPINQPQSHITVIGHELVNPEVFKE